MSRVGAIEDPTLEGSDLTTTIGRASGSAGFDNAGNPLYRNRNQVKVLIFLFLLRPRVRQKAIFVEFWFN